MQNNALNLAAIPIFSLKSGSVIGDQDLCRPHAVRKPRLFTADVNIGILGRRDSRFDDYAAFSEDSVVFIDAVAVLRE